MAVILRLLSVWACVIALGGTLTTPSQAQDLPDAADSFSVTPELIVPLGPVIHYILPGLPDPELHFYDAAGHSADGHILAVTATVVGVPTIREQIERATEQVSAFPVSLDGDDVVYLVAFPPGVITAHVASRAGATGEVLLEFYDVPETHSGSGRA